MVNLILSGGSGTRLWPLSRKMMPKQFYPLLGDKSLFEQTIERNAGWCDEFWVVTNSDQAELARQQLGKRKARITLEPIGRNTAPAIALVCHQLPANTLVLVSASDHLIKKTDSYRQAIERAAALATAGNLVTFGIQPHYPETGFGYIEAAGEEVVSFKEKPDLATATRYVTQGNYYWNSGMFCFQAGVFLAELAKYNPEVYMRSKAALENIAADESTQYIALAAMQAIPDISIDYAVMEKSDKVKVVAADMGWSDLGSFDALYEELERDENGNTAGKNIYFVDAANNLVINHSQQKVIVLDQSDLVVVQTPTALLIAKKGQSQHVKQVVDLLKKENAPELDRH